MISFLIGAILFFVLVWLIVALWPLSGFLIAGIVFIALDGIVSLIIGARITIGYDSNTLYLASIGIFVLLLMAAGGFIVELLEEKS